MTGRLWTRDQMHHELGLSYSVIDTARRLGDLPSVQPLRPDGTPMRRHYFRDVDVQAWLASITA
jgi:hypothetical protein